MLDFDHEKLDVYRVAIDFVALADDVIEKLPRGRARVVAMLTKMVLMLGQEPGWGTGSGSGSND